MVGSGDEAVDVALELFKLVDEITLVHEREDFRSFHDNVGN